MSKIFSNKITFKPHTELADAIMEPPTPSIKHLPDWYKRLNKYIYPEKKSYRSPISSEHGHLNLTAKTCIPLVDALSAGYMITLPSDVAAFRDPDYPFRLSWEISPQLVYTHSGDQLKGMEIPTGYEPSPYKWNTFWEIGLPKGYSMLFTHPLNRFDLPFYSFTGVVDLDQYKNVVHIPFLLKENFEGIIPKGTPIAQIIPFKRENWKSERLEYDPKSRFIVEDQYTLVEKSYKKRWWTRKEYR